MKKARGKTLPKPGVRFDAENHHLAVFLGNPQYLPGIRQFKPIVPVHPHTVKSTGEPLPKSRFIKKNAQFRVQGD
ncbi:MAG: hypothetical protein SH820_08585 [Xanthomonadales bacterium]|nr:hypothetical protein [Xanthomonadales bacterium]